MLTYVLSTKTLSIYQLLMRVFTLKFAELWTETIYLLTLHR
jgi:hypothetical protein